MYLSRLRYLFSPIEAISQKLETKVFFHFFRHRKKSRNLPKIWYLVRAQNHDFHLKNGSRLIFHRSWPISTKKFRLMKKKISQKNPKKFFSKFCIHQNASKMHILAGRGDISQKVRYWLMTKKISPKVKPRSGWRVKSIVIDNFKRATCARESITNMHQQWAVDWFDESTKVHTGSVYA